MNKELKTQIEIPDGWEKRMIKDLGKIITGTTPPTANKEYYLSGGYQFISPADLGNTTKISTTFKEISAKGLKVSRALPKNSVCFVCIGSTIGKVGITVKEETATNQQINSIIVNDEFDPFFATYLLIFNSKYIASFASPSPVPILSKGKFEEILIWVCLDKKEQKKIAAVLFKIQKAIEVQESIIKTTQELKKSTMHHVFTYGLYGEKTKETEIGKMPESWRVASLNDVCAIERGKFTHRPRNDPAYYGGNIPFIQTGDVTNSNGRISTHSQTLSKLGLSVSKIFPAGTICITIAANIGDTAILEFDSAFPDSIIGLTPKLLMNRYYLEYYLRTQKTNMIQQAPKGTQMNINIQFLKPWPVLYPPKSEQKEIVENFQSIDQKIELHTAKKSALQDLFKTMLNRLMTGEIRVKDLDINVLGFY